MDLGLAEMMKHAQRQAMSGIPDDTNPFCDVRLKRMDLTEIMKQLERQSMPGIDDTKPSEAFLSFFPGRLRDPVLQMTAVPMTTQLLPTFIIGTIADAYTNEMWDKDVAEVCQHFNLSQGHYYPIKMIPVEGSPKVLNSADAIHQIETALQNIARVESWIRIVRIGIANTVFFFDAVSYLLKEWQYTGDKQVQFVTTGDAHDNECSQFCKSLCLSGVCKVLQFYNTHDYHPFGFYKSRWHRC
jgi:hypothetical protein